MSQEKVLDLIGIGNPIKDLLMVVDVVPPADGGTHVRAISGQGGGNCPTAIVAAARQGIKCGAYGHVGDDAKGKFCIEDYERHGIDVSHIITQEGKATLMVLAMAETSTQSRRFFGTGCTTTLITPEELDYEYLLKTRLIHLEGCNDTVYAVADFARENGIITSIDAGGWDEGYVGLESKIDLFVASEFYMKGRFPGMEPEKAVKEIYKSGCKIAVITLGAEGLVGCADGEVFRLPAFSGLEIVDTTGAGDVFHGAFAAAYLMGKTPIECARYASAVSFIKCNCIGGRAGIPTREMVEHFLETGEVIHQEELDARVDFYHDMAF